MRKYIEKVFVFSKISLGKKSCFISYLYNDNKVKPLHIMLPKIGPYVKHYDGQIKMDVSFY